MLKNIQSFTYYVSVEKRTKTKQFNMVVKESALSIVLC